MNYRLTGASVDLRGAVALRYTVTGNQPQTGSVLFSTTFFSADENYVEQLGFKLVDGCVVAAFSFDHAATSNPMQRNYRTNPSRAAEVWMIILPPDALRAARGGHWRADLDVNGQPGGSIDGTPSMTITADQLPLTTTEPT